MNTFNALGTALGTVTEDTGEIVAYTIALVIMLLVARILLVVHKKWNISIPDPLLKTLDDLVQRGVASAVHYGVDKVVAVEGKMPGSAVAEHAAEWVLSMTNNKKIIALGKEYIKKYAESHLGQQALNAKKAIL